MQIGKFRLKLGVISGYSDQLPRLYQVMFKENSVLSNKTASRLWGDNVMLKKKEAVSLKFGIHLT
jgi:hypothetical protein